MDEKLIVSFLRSRTEALPHSERSLLDHLLGTHRLLIDWGARRAVCDAGLFHSVYGTQDYKITAVPLSLRLEVQYLIGDDAESLVWLFCMLRRETLAWNLPRQKDFTIQHRLTSEWLPLSAAQFQDLVTMTFANMLEPRPHISWMGRRRCSAYLRPFRSITIPGAQAAFDRLDVRWWELWK